MSRHLLCVAVLLAALAAGCSDRPSAPAPTPGRWSLDIEGEGAKAIPVAVVDTTGLVTGARPGQVVAPDVVGPSGAVGIDDVEQELSIDWTANSCATGSTVTLQPVSGAISIDIAVASQGGCDLLGYRYGLVLDLSAPIGDRAVIVTQDFPHARSWGADLLASDGRRRPLLVVDRSRRVQWVAPMNPAQLDPAESGATVRPAGERSVVVSWLGDVCDTRVDIALDIAAGRTTVQITLANESHVPCIGPLRVEGVRLDFRRPVDPDSIHATLISRH